MSWAIFGAALVVAAIVAGLAKAPGMATSLGIAAAVVGVVAPAVSTAIRGQIDQQAKARATGRALTAGSAFGSTVVRDVSVKRVRVHRAVRDDIGYVDRDVQAAAVKALRFDRRLLIVGPSMSGKTRLALAVAKAVAPEFEFYRPADGKSLHQRLADGVRVDQVLVWLDDLERFSATGLSDEDLITLLESPAVLVMATIRTGEYEALQPLGDIKPPGWEVAAWFSDPVWLDHRWSESELDRLSETRTGREVLAEARRYGLANYLGGAPLIDRKLAIGRDQHPVGYAVVRAAVDWRRLGMAQQLTPAILNAVILGYTRLGHSPAVEDQVKDGLGWATKKLNHTVALVTDDDGLVALDLVMDRLAAAPEPVPDVMTKTAMGIADPTELLAIGYLFYETGDLDAAAAAWTGACTIPEAAFNLGVLSSTGPTQPDVAKARHWYEIAADAGHTGAMVNLGNLLVDKSRTWSGAPDVGALIARALGWSSFGAAAAPVGGADAVTDSSSPPSERVNSPELVEARRWYETAAATGRTEAMVNLGHLLAASDPPDLNRARHWYENAAALGDTEAMVGLGHLLAALDPPDLIEARQWYEAAAADGHVGAQMILADGDA